MEIGHLSKKEPEIEDLLDIEQELILDRLDLRYSREHFALIRATTQALAAKNGLKVVSRAPRKEAV